MTDNSTTSAEMNIKEYAEQSYKGAALNAKQFARIPTRLSVFIETYALANGVSSSDITRHALEKYCSANGYDSHHRL